MADAVSIIVPSEIDRWAKAFGRTPEVTAQAAERNWTKAVEGLYKQSQAYVHIDTWELRESGGYGVDMEEGGLYADGWVEYDAPHALIEHDRGGDHAYLQIAYEMVSGRLPLYQQAVFDEVIKSWEDA